MSTLRTLVFAGTTLALAHTASAQNWETEIAATQNNYAIRLSYIFHTDLIARRSDGSEVFDFNVLLDKILGKGSITESTPPLGQRILCRNDPWYSLCVDRYSTPTIASYDASFRQILAVHQYLRDKIQPASDPDVFWRVENWMTYVPYLDSPFKLRWDCEKYAITSRDILSSKALMKQLGIDGEALADYTLRLFVVKRLDNGEGHLILAIVTDRWILISDSLKPDLYLLSDLSAASLKTIWYSWYSIMSDFAPNKWTAPSLIGQSWKVLAEMRWQASTWRKKKKN